ncbi:Bacterial membrane flanked domain protein [Actinomadura rubteroloni]|uniref:Bacterial membrane flanked domain protein n=1 Tax=Actinomadura rubteroloni TaxID=1926885 RepID=A0A2P4UCS8_9ACTN|nr:PH domain-containing protein [Actinomadura rubteroloni]POM22851.1 Bacterial membrane flanked domain protein [Actinomadura rubteroloni]
MTGPATRPPGERGAVAPAGRQRLHPLTFVVGATRELMALLAAGATGLLVGGVSTAFYFTLIGMAFGLAFHVTVWATFTYTVRDDRIELRRSLIRRTVKSIPRDRIRGVDVTTSFGHRLLGLAVVRVDAGADGGEGELNAVSRREAARLRRVLLARTAVDAPPRVRVLARMRRRWYLYAPLSGAYLLTPFALAGSLLGFLYDVGDDLGLVTRDRIARLGHDVAGLPGAAVVAAAAVLLVAMPVMSVIVFTLFNGDFTVRERDGSLVAERGFVTRRSVALELRRVRGVELVDNPFERAARVVRLGALVTGLGDAAHRGRLLPAAPRGYAAEVAERVLGPVPGPLTAHPRAARGRRVVRAAAPPLGVGVVAASVGQGGVAVLCAVLTVLAVPLGLDRYRQLGHAADATRFTLRSGSLLRRQVVVDRTAVVGWRVRQSLFQRRAGLATLDAAVGAGDGGYAGLDMAARDAVAFAAALTPDWVLPFLEPPDATPGGAPRT